jgi:pilus assembly protein Flp/PilA
MLNKVMNFLRDEEGASAVEYALIAGLIAVVLVVAVGVLNGGFTTVFTNIKNSLTGAAT